MGRLSTFSLSVLMTSVALPFSAAAQDTQIEFDDEIIVRGVNIPDEKRATAEISNVLTDVKLQRTGDADIAGALRRVTGLSLSQGKFVVVRGLNERYSNLTLNGSPLPSPEPLRRVAPLDLFPTSIIRNVLVQKTFSPEYSGEFGGGLIELRTKAVPDESFLEFKTSIGLDLVTTGSD
ncbi:MAG: TonB-dependent receptor plug domain-containing protein, partial [Pseudomonadota bacterium]